MDGHFSIVEYIPIMAYLIIGEVDLPFKDADFPVRYVNVYQQVSPQ